MSVSEIVTAELQGRDTLRAQKAADGSWAISAVGCKELLDKVRSLRKSNPDVKLWPPPNGNSHVEILLRELIAKVRNEWKFPLEQVELCHCRAITTVTVDQAIVAGAHTIETVRLWTSANTACGTCKPEIETLLKFRLV